MLIKLLASQTNDYQLSETIYKLDYKSYKKSELTEAYFLLFEHKPNFKSKLDAYESIKRSFRSRMSTLAHFRETVGDSTIVDKLKASV